MSKRPIELPERHCEFCHAVLQRRMHENCGQREDMKKFLARRFCSHACHDDFRNAQPALLKGKGHRIAQRSTRTACDACGFDDQLGTHHIDGNPLNNEIDNLQTLCVFCHTFWHNMLRRTERSPFHPMPKLTWRAPDTRPIVRDVLIIASPALKNITLSEPLPSPISESDKRTTLLTNGVR